MAPVPQQDEATGVGRQLTFQRHMESSLHCYEQLSFLYYCLAQFTVNMFRPCSSSPQATGCDSNCSLRMELAAALFLPEQGLARTQNSAPTRVPFCASLCWSLALCIYIYVQDRYRWHRGVFLGPQPEFLTYDPLLSHVHSRCSLRIEPSQWVLTRTFLDRSGGQGGSRSYACENGIQVRSKLKNDPGGCRGSWVVASRGSWGLGLKFGSRKPNRYPFCRICSSAAFLVLSPDLDDP